MITLRDYFSNANHRERPSSIKGEFEQATQQMLIARDELCQAMEKQGTPKKERVMPDVSILEPL